MNEKEATMTDTTAADEAPVAHDVQRLKGWDEETFTWTCTCGQENTEPLPINEALDPPARDIGEARPGVCAAS